MDRKPIGKVLLATPGATLAIGGAASAWETPRDWIGAQFAGIGVAMTNPFVTILVTLLIVAYIAAIIWCFIEPKTAMSAADQSEVEAAKERRGRRRKILNEAREMVAKHELQTRHDWRQTTRYDPAFAAVRPHLSEAYMKRLGNTRMIEIGVPGMHEPLVSGFLTELDRLEREWVLS